MNRVFALANNEESIRTAEQERFNRITAKYILICTEKDEIPNGIEITPDEVHRLTEADMRWLFDCLTVLVAEQKFSVSESDTIADKMDKLENALKAEKEKLANGE